MTPGSWYNAASRELQDEFDSRRLADRLNERVVHAGLTAEDRAFVERSPMFFLATADGAGRPECSHKGGLPGFVHVEDERTLTFPDYDGNGMFRSLGNILENPYVGLLFVNFFRPDRLRINGRATVERDDALLAAFPGAQVVVRVRVEQVFPNCPRYVHTFDLVDHSAYAPQAHGLAPIPEWKASKAWRDALPQHDLATLPVGGVPGVEFRAVRFLQRRVVWLRRGLNTKLRRVEKQLGEAARRRADAVAPRQQRPSHGPSAP